MDSVVTLVFAYLDTELLDEGVGCVEDDGRIAGARPALGPEVAQLLAAIFETEQSPCSIVVESRRHCACVTPFLRRYALNFLISSQVSKTRTPSFICPSSVTELRSTPLPLLDSLEKPLYFFCFLVGIFRPAIWRFWKNSYADIKISLWTPSWVRSAYATTVQCVAETDGVAELADSMPPLSMKLRILLRT